MQVSITIEIASDFSYEVKALGSVIKVTDSGLPRVLDSPSSLIEAVTALDTFVYCCGNEDSKFFPIQAERHGTFKNTSGI